MRHRGNAHFRAQADEAVRLVEIGQHMYATPDSVTYPIHGMVVEIDRFAIALDTELDGIVWVHVSDVPGLLGDSRTLASQRA